jgi:hypothetical protein
MQVTTRNQRKNFVASSEKLQSPNPDINKQEIGKVRPDPNNLLPWFVSVAQEGVKEVEKCKLKQIEIRHLIKCRPKNNLKSKETMESEVRLFILIIYVLQKN